MKFIKRFFVHIILLFLSLSFSGQLKAQEGIPIYYDHLTDNLFLIHPAMAGASYCNKARLTGRAQWMGVKDFPMLQTFSLASHLGSTSGFGFILFNDRNGYHAQKGIQVAFAQHLHLSRGRTLNQLSLGISAMYTLHQLDQSTFDPSDFDPVISYTLQSKGYFNIDAGFAYHVQNFFLLGTVKNVLNMIRPLYSPGVENVNLRNYVGHIGYFIKTRGSFHMEPSVMVQYKEYNGNMIVDGNLKFYHEFPAGTFFWGASYRNYMDNSPYTSVQNLSPIAGFYFKNFIISYVYTHQLSGRAFTPGGFHQISLGYNFGCKTIDPTYGCPHIR